MKRNEIDLKHSRAYCHGMNRSFPIFITGVFLQFLSAADLGPYQLILDKQLLGMEKVTPSVVNQPAPVAAQPSWSRDYRMTMITQDEDTLRVGLQSLKDQSSVLLIEGETAFPDEGFQLISGDYMQGTAVIRYRGSEHRFRLEAGSVSPSKPEIIPVSPRDSRRSDTRRIIPTRNYRTRSPAPDSTEESEPPPEKREFKSPEELNAHLQEQLKDAIRNDKPPLPIPLTQESDDQLVKEGVLPPQN